MKNFKCCITNTDRTTITLYRILDSNILSFISFLFNHNPIWWKLLLCDFTVDLKGNLVSYDLRKNLENPNA